MMILMRKEEGRRKKGRKCGDKSVKVTLSGGRIDQWGSLFRVRRAGHANGLYLLWVGKSTSGGAGENGRNWGGILGRFHDQRREVAFSKVY